MSNLDFTRTRTQKPRFRVWALAVMLLTALFAIPSFVQAEPVRDVANMTNQYRAKYGLKPLHISRNLERVAEAHGEDMARYSFFSHSGSDGSDIGDRALRAGYQYCVIAENIAQGHRSPQAVTRGWIKSPGHRQNILDSDVTEIGVTRGRGNTWVMVLGSRTC
ncbi:CAP domain-containing protein [Cognatishimia activa]|uniref:Cysteine-rich secretory protein family protein n=1 Tax=Cognatishimia activa TaxID=1715691 RepID=A0A0N7MBZ6_9RHOB|nr:CAP domain-containing protein [Cognatishimia activa]CUI77842.1 Cysteine-rich secretory protein family protein [Cognatishimia activa]CUK26792.1 Cysteine-rich secretory protein family protein [Cognatishimia activa]